MKENKIFEELLQNTYDKDKNYKSILSRMEGGRNMKRKILNIAAIIMIIIGFSIITPKIYARIAFNVDYKKYQERKISRENIAIKESFSNGFAEKIDMDYVYKDGIGVKIKSLMLTSDYIGIDFEFNFNEEVVQENSTQRFTQLVHGFAVYDENNNIYCIEEELHDGDLTYWKKLYKELNIKKKVISTLNDTMGYGIKEVKGKTALTSIEGKTIKGFPESKKLFVRVFQVGYKSYNKISPGVEYKTLSDNEWQFEIDIPERFYERTDVELKLSKEVDKIKLNKATLTETSLTVRIEVDGLSDYIAQIRHEENAGELLEDIVYITDGEDKVYIAPNIGSGKENEQQLRFGIGKKQLDKKIFLHINVGNIREVIELVK